MSIQLVIWVSANHFPEGDASALDGDGHSNPGGRMDADMQPWTIEVLALAVGGPGTDESLGNLEHAVGIP